MTGPSAPIRMLNSDKSPWMTPAHSISTTCLSSAWKCCRACFRRELHIIQTRRRVAVRVGDQFHQQHAGMEVVRLRHAHAGSGQPIQGVDFGVLPGFFLRFAAIARAFRHGARLAAVLHLAVFRVIDALAKAALVGFLVNLGAAHLVAAANDEDHRLLAAHELADHVIDQAVFEQRFESFRDFHGASFTRWDGGEGGFEPPLVQALNRISNPAHSTTLPSLR